MLEKARNERLKRIEVAEAEILKSIQALKKRANDPQITGYMLSLIATVMESAAKDLEG